MSIAEKFEIIADKVYNAGYEKGKAEGGSVEVVLTAEDFEIGGLMGIDGTDAGANATQNRIRTAQIPCTLKHPISVICNSNAQWLVHFFNNGTWIERYAFTSGNCENIVVLCSKPFEVTHVRLSLAYVSNVNVTDISDLLSNVTITKIGSLA